MNGFGICSTERLQAELAERDEKDLHFDALPNGTVVRVSTRNTQYLFRKHEGGIDVKGGPRFPDWTSGYFNGSTWGGSMIRFGWIGYGMNMEFGSDDHPCLISTPVESWEIQPLDHHVSS